MRIPLLTDDLSFPSPERLLLAYSRGIFPWPHQGLPLLWFSPDPRFVVEPARAHIATSLRKRARKCPYTITADTAFREVMLGCSTSPRHSPPSPIATTSAGKKDTAKAASTSGGAPTGRSASSTR